MKTIKQSTFIAFLLGAFFCGACLVSPTRAQQTEKQQKQAQKRAEKQAEVDRQNAVQRRKVEAAQQKQTLKMRDVVSVNGVGERARIEVQLRDKTRINGWVSQLTMTDFVVNGAGGGEPRTISYKDVAKAKGKNPAAKNKGKSTAMTLLDLL